MSDRFNPDERLRERSLVGIHILSGLRPVGEDTWDGGTIYDPTSGRSYSCAVSLDGDDRLVVDFSSGSPLPGTAPAVGLEYDGGTPGDGWPHQASTAGS